MDSDREGRLAALRAQDGADPGILRPLPGQLEVRAPAGALAPHKGATRHGWHSRDAVQIPTSLTCAQCPLYHVKRKDDRHPLACPEGRKNRICPILTRLQLSWAEGLIDEVQQVTGEPPTPSDNARIEQVVRHRSRIFQVENYLKVAGLIDLRRGEVRNVADRLVTIENALSRTLAEFRQSLAERREQQPHRGPRLQDYLREIQEGGARVVPAAPPGEPASTARAEPAADCQDDNDDAGEEAEEDGP